jgi:hypothetical protein
MIIGVAPPGWLDKLESICGGKEETDEVFFQQPGFCEPVSMGLQSSAGLPG